jgi:DNA invertase Pin-like site-specific DNA recombinase
MKVKTKGGKKRLVPMVVPPGSTKKVSAARYIYEQRHGVTLTSDQQLCHTCNGGSGAHGCVNPTHVYIGDAKTNMQDAAKLTREDIPRIIEMRENGSTLGGIAAEFGVSAVTILNVIKGRTWSNVSGIEPVPLATGRAATGESNGRSRLTVEDVYEIRRVLDSGGASQAQLAAKYGITTSQVGRIHSRQSWSHLSDAPH